MRESKENLKSARPLYQEKADDTEELAPPLLEFLLERWEI